jgi:hypothetical protein
MSGQTTQDQAKGCLAWYNVRYRADMLKRFAKIVYAIVPAGGAVYGMAAHNSYGMGLFSCGMIGGVLGLIAGTILILVSGILLSVVLGLRPSDFTFSTFKKLKK